MSSPVITRSAPRGVRSTSQTAPPSSTSTSEKAASPLIRLCVVDDRLIARESLVALLEHHDDMKVVRRCARAEVVSEVSGYGCVDLILLDFDSDKERVISLLSQLEQLPFKGRIVILAGSVSDTDAVRLAARGVSGILCKDHSPEVLAECIRRVAAGEFWFDQALFRAILTACMRVLKKMDHYELTDRERELMRCLAQGLANKEIATRIDIEETAVKACFHRMFKKLGVHSRGQLALIGLTRFGNDFKSDHNGNG
jgi:DNA-binding NarL/FixJ family response regulator